MDLQQMINAMTESMRQTRAQYQMTLGGLVEALERMPPETAIAYQDGNAPGKPDSYRGYHSDLAFDDITGPVEASALLEMVHSILGQTFGGYKMEMDTPVWRSGYGIASGIALMDIRIDGDGNATILTKQID